MFEKKYLSFLKTRYMKQEQKKQRESERFPRKEKRNSQLLIGISYTFILWIFLQWMISSSWSSLYSDAIVTSYFIMQINFPPMREIQR